MVVKAEEEAGRLYEPFFNYMINRQRVCVCVWVSCLTVSEGKENMKLEIFYERVKQLYALCRGFFGFFLCAGRMD
jgi:hypothetical protein